MTQEKVLICGGGITGSVLAFWLAKHDFRVTVIERSKAAQKAGQGLEIEEPALAIVKAMGLLERLESVKTGELGCVLEDIHSQVHAKMELGGISPTGQLEIMRGELVGVLTAAADAFPNVTFVNETTIESLRQTEDKVFVEMQSRETKGTRTEEFDFVVGTDGVKSKTRDLIMGPPQQIQCYKPINTYVAYFSIPREEGDWPYSRLCQFPDRRVMWIRPIGEHADTTSVYLAKVGESAPPELRQANAAGDRLRQKEAFAELFHDAGWQCPRVIKQMIHAENFYSDDLEQVKLSRWSEGRVALCGDSAWAPTPLTGEGNQLAIIGAWVLAQEMSRDRSITAFANYEKRLRAQVEESQSIPLGGYAPYLFAPKTSFGIFIVRKLIKFATSVAELITWSGILKLFPDYKPKMFDLQMAES